MDYHILRARWDDTSVLLSGHRVATYLTKSPQLLIIVHSTIRDTDGDTLLVPTPLWQRRRRQ